jgi:hypothetical protein
MTGIYNLITISYDGLATDQVGVDIHPCVGHAIGREVAQHSVGRPDAA